MEAKFEEVKKPILQEDQYSFENQSSIIGNGEESL